MEQKELQQIKQQAKITIDIPKQKTFLNNKDYHLDYLQNNTFVVFDLETTGLSPYNSNIVEIGAVKIENGKITEVFSTYVNPECLIPKQATQIHGITNTMVQYAPKVDKALTDFYNFASDSILLAYNIKFDYSFITHFGNKYNLYFNHTQLDVLAFAKQYLKGLFNYKLTTVCNALQIPLDNAHRAYHDAKATAQVFITIINEVIKE